MADGFPDPFETWLRSRGIPVDRRPYSQMPRASQYGGTPAPTSGYVPRRESVDMMGRSGPYVPGVGAVSPPGTRFAPPGSAFGGPTRQQDYGPMPQLPDAASRTSSRDVVMAGDPVSMRGPMSMMPGMRAFSPPAQAGQADITSILGMVSPRMASSFRPAGAPPPMASAYSPSEKTAFFAKSAASRPRPPAQFRRQAPPTSYAPGTTSTPTGGLSFRDNGARQRASSRSIGRRKDSFNNRSSRGSSYSTGGSKRRGPSNR